MGQTTQTRLRACRSPATRPASGARTSVPSSTIGNGRSRASSRLPTAIRSPQHWPSVRHIRSASVSSPRRARAFGGSEAPARAADEQDARQDPIRHGCVPSPEPCPSRCGGRRPRARTRARPRRRRGRSHGSTRSGMTRRSARHSTARPKRNFGAPMRSASSPAARCRRLSGPRSSKLGRRGMRVRGKGPSATAPGTPTSPPRFAATRRRCVCVLPRLGRIRLAELRRPDLQNLADELLADGLSASAIGVTLLPLRAVFAAPSAAESWR